MARKMPNNKKNKKKGGNKQQQRRNRQRSTTTLEPNWKEIASFSADRNSNLNPPVASSSERNKPATIYARYKEATERFKMALIGKLPDDYEKKDLKTANDLMDAVDFLSQKIESGNNIAIEHEMMSDLNVAMAARKNAVETYGDRCDSGHEHFLIVLGYCWSRLRKLNGRASESNKNRETSKEDPTTMNNIKNYFETLSLEEDGEQEEHDAEATFSNSETVTKRPIVPKTLSLDVLLRTNSYTDAMIFLAEFDRFIGYIAHTFKDLKMMAKAKKRGVVGKLIEAVALVNYSIQEIAFLERDLAHRHPHLSNIYRVWAVLRFPKLATEITEIVTKQSPKGSAFKETVAFELIGDIIQNAFSRPADQYQEVLAAFLKKWRLPQEQHLECACYMVDIKARQEAPFHKDSQRYKVFDIAIEHPWVQSNLSRINKNEWIQNPSSNIGGGKSLTKTVRLLQEMPNRVGDTLTNGAILVDEGVYGPDWDENKGFVPDIAGEMDSYLLRHVMPLLVTARFGFTDFTPFKRELFGFFSEIETYSKHPERPVSSPVAFGAHALLTAVFELQGDCTIQFVGMEVKAALSLFKEQLELLREKAKSGKIARSENWQKILDYMISICDSSFVNITENRGEIEQGPSEKAKQVLEERAIWNPLSAGTMLLFNLYFNNINLGSSLVNMNMQLIGVIHLFNGLKQGGYLKAEDVRLLSFLDKTFKDNKVIWKWATEPAKGELLFRFLLSIGNPVEIARKREQGFRHNHHIGGRYEDTDTGRRGAEKDITLSPLELLSGDFSPSYRMLCEHNFSDLPNTTDIDRLSALVNAMRADVPLININLACLGEALDSYLGILASHIGVDMNPGIQRNYFCVEYFLGMLDASDQPAFQVVATDAAQRLVEHFSRNQLYIF